VGPSSKHDPPLRGLRVLNTRAATGAAALSEPLRALGATVVELPLLAFAPPADWGPVERRWQALAPGDWVVFTSATAVDCLLAHVRDGGGDAGALNAARVAAIGPGTAEALRDAGVSVALVPERFQGEGLLAALLGELPPAARVWVPRAEAARAVLIDGLRQAGHRVCVTAVYRTVPAAVDSEALRRLLREGGLDWIVFTSPSAVRYFLEALGVGRQALPAASGWPGVACLGAVTARTAREAGLTVQVQPEAQHLAGLVAALAAYVAATAKGESMS